MRTSAKPITQAIYKKEAEVRQTHRTHERLAGGPRGRPLTRVLQTSASSCSIPHCPEFQVKMGWCFTLWSSGPTPLFVWTWHHPNNKMPNHFFVINVFQGKPGPSVSAGQTLHPQYCFLEMQLSSDDYMKFFMCQFEIFMSFREVFTFSQW